MAFHEWIYVLEYQRRYALYFHTKNTYSSSTVILWFIIYIYIWSFRWPKYISHIYLSRVPGSQLLKPLKFPVIRYKSVFGYINEVTFGPPSLPGNALLGWGWLPGEPTTWLEGWNFQSHSLISREEIGLEVESIANGK